MKSIYRLNFLGTTLLILLLISACSKDNSLSETTNANSQLEENETSILPVLSDVGSGGNNLSFQFVATESGIAIDPDGTTTSSIGNEYTIDSEISEVSNTYPKVNFSAIGQNSTKKEDVIEQQNSIARQIPTNVSYSGGNSIEYTIDGQQKSRSINQDQKNLISGVVQEFNTAYSAYQNMPAPTGSNNPLLQKSDQEIKQMLQSEGYNVTILGDMKFRITKILGTVEVTETFNAETFSIEDRDSEFIGDSDYSQNFQNGSFKPVRSIGQ